MQQALQISETMNHTAARCNFEKLQTSLLCGPALRQKELVLGINTEDLITVQSPVNNQINLCLPALH